MPYKIQGREYWMIWEIAELWGIAPQSVRRYVRLKDFRESYRLPTARRKRKWVYVIPAREVRRVGKLFGYE